MAILYDNKARFANGRGYDRVYAENRAKFSHEATFEALPEVLSPDWLSAQGTINTLDVGCGQGQVLARIHELAAAAAPAETARSRFVGMDSSVVAIEQCEREFGHLEWVVDTFQDFAAGVGSAIPRAYDLLVNKSGITQVRTEDEYAEIVGAISGLLAIGGRYLFIMNKQFQARWFTSRGEWRRTVFEMNQTIFGAPWESTHHRSYHFLVYTKA